MGSTFNMKALQSLSDNLQIPHSKHNQATTGNPDALLNSLEEL